MKPEPRFSKKARAVKPGRYRHYKGGEYDVFGAAYHSDTGRELVVYRALYGKHCLFVRSLAVFTGKARHKGKNIFRFKRIGDFK